MSLAGFAVPASSRVGFVRRTVQFGGEAGGDVHPLKRRGEVFESAPGKMLLWCQPGADESAWAGAVACGVARLQQGGEGEHSVRIQMRVVDDLGHGHHW